MPTFKKLERWEIPHRGIARYGDAIEGQANALRTLTSAEGASFFERANRAARTRKLAEYFDQQTQKIITDTLRQATPFYITEAIGEILWEIKDTIPEFTIRPETLPTPTAWCWLAKPRAIQAPIDSKLSLINKTTMHAISWITRPGHAAITLWFALKENPMTTLHPMATFGWPFGQTLTKAMDTYISIVDETIDQTDEDTSVAKKIIEDATKLLATLLVFIQDRILIPLKEQPNRATRRRIEQLQPGHDTAIQVIYIRHAKTKAIDRQEATESTWSCQWLVRGHWRRQYYPSRDEHRPKWIAPYAKGPEDKPLKKPRQQLFAVTR